MESSILPIIIVSAMIVAILTSLGFGLFFLLTSQREENLMNTARALTVRVTLSIVLFLGLFLAFYMGWFQPHGIFG